jgi:hypothetical protein
MLIMIEAFNGEKFSGKSPTAVVEAMQSGTWGGYQADGVKGYMKQVAKRVSEWNGRAIRIDNAKHFLEDLEKAGFIRSVTGTSVNDKEP